MKAKHPNIEVVAVEYGAGDPVKSADFAKAIMTKNPDLKGFFGANEGSIKGVLNALKETGNEGKIVAIGYDSGQQQIDAINAGTEAGADHPEPHRHRRQVRRPRPWTPSRASPWTRSSTPASYWFDKTNIDAPEIEAVLYK